MIEFATPNGQHIEEVKPKLKVAITNYRVPVGDAVFVRLLSEEYGGLFIHYYRGRSSICRGDNGECTNAMHRVDRAWKGYCAAEVRNPRDGKWYPYCFELTEHLELAMRGVFARGQVWEVWRNLTTKKTKEKVDGKLHDELDPATLPAAFNIIPCLRALYHSDVIDLSHSNPMPAREYAEVSDGPAPKILQPKPQDTAAPRGSMAEEFRKKQKERAQEKPSPTAEKRP